MDKGWQHQIKDVNAGFPMRGNLRAAADSTHLVESEEGLTWPWLFSSHTLLASSLPMAVITLMSSMGQSSRSRERTRDRCVPRLRWIPEHSMQMRAPRLRLAQSGSAGQGTQQSAQGNAQQNPPAAVCVWRVWLLFCPKAQLGGLPGSLEMPTLEENLKE